MRFESTTTHLSPTSSPSPSSSPHLRYLSPFRSPPLRPSHFSTSLSYSTLLSFSFHLLLENILLSWPVLLARLGGRPTPGIFAAATRGLYVLLLLYLVIYLFSFFIIRRQQIIFMFLFVGLLLPSSHDRRYVLFH